MSALSPALEIRGLRKSFGKPAVDGLDLIVNPGEFYALLGPNGAGKPTTLRMIAGLLPADCGEISVFGVDARRRPVEAKRIVAWLPDEPQLYDKLDPLEYLEFVAGLWGVEPAKARRERAERLLADARPLRAQPRALRGFFARDAAEGRARRRAHPRAAAPDARRAADRPRRGLGAAGEGPPRRARARAGAAIILTTHILEVAERIADRIGILARGRLSLRARSRPLRAADGLAARASRTCSSTSRQGGPREPRPRAFASFVAHRPQTRRARGLFDPLKNSRRCSASASRWRSSPPCTRRVAGGLCSRRAAKPGPNGATFLAAAMRAGVFFVLPWAIASPMSAVARLLAQRGDLDLLFASPVSARATLAARLFALAIEAVGSSALLLAPLADVCAPAGPAALARRFIPALFARRPVRREPRRWRSRWRWLFAVGPRRARVVSQIGATVVGASAVLARRRRVAPEGAREPALTSRSGRAGVRAPPATLPERAAAGDPAAPSRSARAALAMFGRGLGLSATVSRGRRCYRRARRRRPGAAMAQRGFSAEPRTDAAAQGASAALARSLAALADGLQALYTPADRLHPLAQRRRHGAGRRRLRADARGHRGPTLGLARLDRALRRRRAGLPRHRAGDARRSRARQARRDRPARRPRSWRRRCSRSPSSRRAAARSRAGLRAPARPLERAADALAPDAGAARAGAAPPFAIQDRRAHRALALAATGRRRPGWRRSAASSASSPWRWSA